MAAYPLTQAMYTQIKESIMNLSLTPGKILSVQQLAVDLDVSRTPVKEALVRLVEEGLVEYGTGRKFKVAGLTVADIREIYDLREHIECMVVDRIVDQITLSQIGQLRGIVAGMQTATDKHDTNYYCDCDLSFHKFLINLYGSKILTGWFESMEGKQQRIRHVGLIRQAQFDQSIIEHGQIINGLEKKDVPSTKNYIIDHCRSTWESMEAVLMANCMFSLPLDEIERIKNVP